ncbi:MAG: EpsI family protein [Thermodesulfovibrio sp. RBG_19FT_COMBO_42_12]|nr:MAG: EpsI family protein [Thermodesulfovibrio sp. RBG_19FT_COMBO_42_12]
MSCKTKFIMVIVLFIAAAALVMFYKVERVTQTRTANLAAIPEEVGGWQMIDEQTSMGTSASEFLNDVLFRTYKREDGKTIILAIAYGADQKQNFSIHVPEGCYRAAGSDVTSIGVVNDADIPGLELKRLLIRDKEKTEPMQYWIVLNGRVITSHFERKIKQVYYSLFNVQAGGVLVRVSSLSNDKEFQKDYEIQRSFINELYKTVDPELKNLLFGGNA